MIKIEKDKDKKKTYLVLYDDSVINEFKILVKSVENKFDEFLCPFINEFLEQHEDVSNKLAQILIDWNKYSYADTLLNMIKEYYDLIYTYVKEDISKIDMKPFVNTKKKTKTSILIEEDDIRSMMELSFLLKLNCILFSTTNYKREIGAKVFNYLVDISNSKEALERLYSVIEKKLSVFKHTDKIMWMFISLYHSKNYETIVNETFNFILNVLFVLFEIKQSRNIVTFFVSFIDQNITWLLRDSYNSNITYLSKLLESSDDNSHHMNNTIETFLIDTKSDFIKVCSYENTLQYIELSTRKFFKKYTRMSERDFDMILEKLYTTPIHKYLVLPIISKITGMDYKYLVNCSKVTHYYLQAYLYFLLMEYNADKFHSTLILLQYGSEAIINESTSSKLKYITEILQKDIRYYTVQNKSIFIKLSLIISTVLNRRQKLVNIFNPNNRKIITPPKFLDQAMEFYQEIFRYDESKLLSKLKQLHLTIINKKEDK